MAPPSSSTPKNNSRSRVATTPSVPYPNLAPEALRLYEDACPGAAFFILQMGNRQQEATIAYRRLGQVFSFVAFLVMAGSAITALALGSQIVATAFVGAGMFGAVGAFLGERPGPPRK